jgi:hypothetical protein
MTGGLMTAAQIGRRGWALIAGGAMSSLLFCRISNR